MSNTPTAIVEARKKFRHAVLTRKDEPLINAMTDEEGGFCFVGFAFESMRIANPDVYYWENGELRKKANDYNATHHAHISRLRFGAILAWEDLTRWLGITDSDIEDLIEHNDNRGWSWEEAWEEFENTIQGR